MKIRAKIICSTSLAAVLCGFQTAPAAGANAAATENPGNPVIARGNGLEITRGDLDEAMAGIKMQTQNLAPANLDGLEKAAAVEILDPNLKPVAATGSDTPATTPAAAPKP